MKRFIAGAVSGFILASVLAIVCFRYQITSIAIGRETIAYRLDRLSGHVDICLVGGSGAGWFSISDNVRALPEPTARNTHPIEFVPDPVQPTSVQP